MMTLVLTPSPRLHVNGVGLFVRMIGVGEPLVFLHGFTGNSKSWSPHVPFFRAHHTCISIDLLGHGNSDTPLDPARYRMDKAVADLIALFDQIGLDKVHLVGYSMGGRVALSLALAHPKRVRSLALESASPGIAQADERRARIKSDEALCELIENEGLEKFIEHWEQQPLFATQNVLTDELRAGLREERLRNTTRGLINSLRGLGSGVMPPLWQKLDQVQCPTLIIVGELDTKYTGIALKMAAVMKQVRVCIVEGAGHTVHLENPNKFNELLLRFLSSVKQ
jgi:2-succinyl-6-hydroxy-2,4-cyclohexadiene-1-carboxylate synthase